MLVRRFLLAAAVCGVAALTASTAGCGAANPASWLDGDPPATNEPAGEGHAGDAGDTSDQPPPTRRNSLEASAQTLYFLEGKLPAQDDGTTSALAGSLVLRGQCHDGSLLVVVTLSGRAGSKETKVSCDGQPHERSLGKVKVGDTLSVELTGQRGTDFAVELVAT